MAASKLKVMPEIMSFTDDCQRVLTIVMSLPGVCMDDIALSWHADHLEVSASSESTLYANTITFCCPVKPEEALTTFQDGILKVNVPLQAPLGSRAA